MKKQIIGSVVAIAVTIFISGCSDKNGALVNALQNQNHASSINMSNLKGKKQYVVFNEKQGVINIESIRTNPLSLDEYRELMTINYKNKDNSDGIRKDCVALNNNGPLSSYCFDETSRNGSLMEYQSNSIYFKREISPTGVVIGATVETVMLPFTVLGGILNTAFNDHPNHGINDDSMGTQLAAPKVIDHELLEKLGNYLNNSLYKQYQKIISDYRQATSIEDKKKYEEEYYKFVNLENVFNKKIISKQGKSLDVDDDFGLNGLLTNTQANGTLKLQAKIALNPNNRYDIPVKYGTHTFKVRFDLLLKYRISGMGISMGKDETISRVATVTLSPNNNYSTIINADFGKYVQSSQGKLLLFSGGQQLIGTKLNVEFEDE